MLIPEEAGGVPDADRLDRALPWIAESFTLPREALSEP
ncbi:hypothetical protein BKA01_004857 [Pseudonocardia eucalypti]|nr:hypothetical protein [Pseudonocardia eucalypti]